MNKTLQRTLAIMDEHDLDTSAVEIYNPDGDPFRASDPNVLQVDVFYTTEHYGLLEMRLTQGMPDRQIHETIAQSLRSFDPAAQASDNYGFYQLEHPKVDKDEYRNLLEDEKKQLDEIANRLTDH